MGRGTRREIGGNDKEFGDGGCAGVTLRLLSSAFIWTAKKSESEEASTRLKPDADGPCL